MPTFLHYTSVRNLAKILRSGSIKLGDLPSANGMVPDAVVNLTTDADPSGHGLLDGPIIPDEAPPHLRASGQAGSFRCADHTKCRLVIEISSDDPMLISAAQQQASEDGILFALEVNGWHPTEQSTDVVMLMRAKEEFDRGTLINKSPTWWYYRSAIPVKLVEFIDIKVSEGTYIRGTVAEALEQIS